MRGAKEGDEGLRGVGGRVGWRGVASEGEVGLEGWSA